MEFIVVCGVKNKQYTKENQPMKSTVCINAILFGNTCVGKSTIIAALNNRQYCYVQSTVGAEFTSKEINVDTSQTNLASIEGVVKQKEGNIPVRIKLWDTAGQERYRSIIKSYFRGKAAAFLVFDVTNRKSFNDCNYWLRTLEEESDNNSIVKFLVGNKCEQKNEPKRTVTFEEAQTWADMHDMMYAEVSAINNAGIMDMFQRAVSRVLMVSDIHPVCRKVLSLDPRSSIQPIIHPFTGITITVNKHEQREENSTHTLYEYSKQCCTIT